jgi:hypothetical protein
MMDYLTKWPEVVALRNQKAETVARTLVEHLITRHGVPEQLLSDRGSNFLSELMQEICKLLGIEKINTSGYHPQTDGLVEKFNSTIINMLSKCVEKHGRNWDQQLPYVLFAYRVAVQESTQESPFYLLYGRDAQIPTETALSQPRTVYQLDFADYRSELVANLSDAWALAHKNIDAAQVKQKKQYDKKSKDMHIVVGDRVMVYMPGTVKGKAWKFARPYHGPYRVLAVTPTNVEVKLVDRPQDASIFVSIDRVRSCPKELEDISWAGQTPKRTKPPQVKTKPKKSHSSCESNSEPYSGPITRARSRKMAEHQ